MKEKNIAFVVTVLVVLAGLVGVLDARLICSASPSNAAVTPDEKMVHSIASSQREGPPSPPVIWTVNFSDFIILVPQNPDEDQASYLVDWGDGTNTGWIGPYDPGVMVTVSHAWDAKGTYDLTVTAKNQDGASDPAIYTLHLSSDLKYFFVSLGYVSMPYIFTIHSEGFPYYLFDWGDGNTSGWIGPGDPGVAEKAWNLPGTYSLLFKTKDINGSETPWSEPFPITIVTPGFYPPPPTIEGPSWGIVNVEYTFTVNMTGDWLAYIWVWGDNMTSGWLGPFNPGQTIRASHAWSHRGSYGIKVKCIDPFGAESDWSAPHNITIYELKRALIVGSYENMSAGVDFITIHAVNLHLILFLPLRFFHDTSGENITFFAVHLKAVITSQSIVGFIRVVI
jgi:hypothetical protein